MRITMITATPATVAAGSGTFVAAEGLAHGLEALGHEVALVRPQRPPGPAGFTAHRFRFNRRLRPAAVAGADWVIGWDMDGYPLAGHPSVRFAAYIHGQLADEARFERGWVALAMRLQARAERRSVRRAVRVLTVSAYSRRRLTELYGRSASDIGVVPPAFDAARWRAALAAATYPTDPERPTVLCVCRMYPRKDVANLLRATDILRRTVPGVRLELVGDGPQRRELVHLARALRLDDCVVFHGQVDFTSLVARYASCDVFCLPSRQEGFGIVYLEAMAAGKPIVACAGTAAEEVLTDGMNGRLVPPGDPAALAAALRDLLADPALRARLGASGPATAATYQPTAVAGRLLEELHHDSPRGMA
jgi:glycosyltransferase involved in cell wall biosynthesis